VHSFDKPFFQLGTILGKVVVPRVCPLMDSLFEISSAFCSGHRHVH